MATALARTPDRSGMLARLSKSVASHIGETAAIWVAIAVVLAVVVVGTASYGLVFLTMSALVAVPVMFVVLLLITRG